MIRARTVSQGTVRTRPAAKSRDLLSSSPAHAAATSSSGSSRLTNNSSATRTRSWRGRRKTSASNSSVDTTQVYHCDRAAFPHRPCANCDHRSSIRGSTTLCAASYGRLSNHPIAFPLVPGFEDVRIVKTDPIQFKPSVMPRPRTWFRGDGRDVCVHRAGPVRRNALALGPNLAGTLLLPGRNANAYATPPIARALYLATFVNTALLLRRSCIRSKITSIIRFASSGRDRTSVRTPNTSRYTRVSIVPTPGNLFVPTCA